MNLLIVINSLGKGGAEKLVEITIPYFIQNGILVTLYLLDESHSYPLYIENVKAAGANVVFANVIGVRNPKHIIRLKKFLQRNHFDVVHVHLFPSLYWVSLAFRMLKSSKRNNIKLIYTEHSIHNKRRELALLKPIEKFVYNSYSNIIAITETVKEKIDRWMNNSSKTIIINNGIDINRIESISHYASDILREELGLKMDSKLMLMVASFIDPKDQSTIVKAMTTLPPDYHILFAGEGALLESVKGLAKDLNVASRVHFLGFRNDVIRLMKSVDINILSSDHEGMSGVTLESLASGKPFLGSDVPGINDMVPDRRFLFHKRDDESLRLRVMAILTNEEEAKNMVSDGLEFVDKFDLRFMIDQHIKLYNS